MIYALIGALVLQSAVLALTTRWFLTELRQSHTAALQANGLPDAARKMQAPSHARVKTQVDDTRARMEASGGVFSAQNPFGNLPHKPEGI